MTVATLTEHDKHVRFQSEFQRKWPTWDAYRSDERVIPSLAWFLEEQWNSDMDHDTFPVGVYVDLVVDRKYFDGKDEQEAFRILRRMEDELGAFCASAAGEGWCVKKVLAYDSSS